jgi:hypothetical protein
MYPSFRTVLIIDTILSVPLILIGINAGLRLWKIQPNAVKTARIYMIYALAYTVTVPFLFFILDFTSEMRNEILKTLVEDVRTLGSLVGWLVYLSVSKRVKATYGTQPAAQNTPQPAGVK